MKKVLIYGLGYNFRVLMQYADLHDVEIVGYVDRAKCGMEINGRRVLAPEEICDIQYDLIFITPEKHEEIIVNLSACYGVEKEKMVLPAQINREYILPRIRDARNIIFNGGNADWFAFLFRSLVKSGRFLIIGTMRGDSVQYVPYERNDEQRCFIFNIYETKQFLHNGFLEFLRATYPNAKMVLLISESCDSQYGLQKVVGPDFSPQYFSDTYDLCVTYLMRDAEKYSFKFHPQIYPASALELEKCEQEADLFYVGLAKNRLALLHSIFLKLTGAGFRCRFWIYNVDKKDQLEIEGIHYNQWLTYEETLREMNKCRCILEVCDDKDETSYRYSEAVVYGKRLLLNDTYVKEFKYYSPENMQIFSNAEDIDLNWFEQAGKDYKYEGDLEPEYFLRQVLKLDLGTAVK